MGVIREMEREQMRTDLPDFRPGDTIRMMIKIQEGGKERLQPFEGAVIRKHGGGINTTFTVRKVSYGVGVERIFPLHSPVIDSIKLLTRGKVRRSKLYYLRSRRGKAARIKVRR